MTQLHQTLAMLHEKPCTTHDFAQTRLSCEYRKNISLLRKQGYAIRATRLSKSCWRYELISEPPQVEVNGQLRMVLT